MDADTRTGADAFVREVVQTQPKEKRPLFREPAAPPPFPIDEMGELRRAAEAVHVQTQAPLAMCSQAVLAAVSLVVQPHFDVILPGAGARPLTGLFLTIAVSGERKSGVDRLALRAVHEFERRQDEAHAAAMGSYVNDLEAWRSARTEALKKAKGKSRSERRAALEAIGPEARKPPSPMLLIADPTPEALVLNLEARPWAGLFTAEGGLFLGGAAFNDETRLRTGALLNILWDGDPVRRLRVVTGKTFLPGRRCSVHLMLQPTLAPLLFGNVELSGIGVLARTLTVYPESTVGWRRFRLPDAVAAACLADYDAKLGAWLDRPLPTRTGNPDALDPTPLPLSLEAADLWIAFYNETEEAQRPGGSLDPIRAFASKLAEHAGRIAAVLALYQNPDAIEVPAEAMAGGIALARYYCAEMLRLHGAASIPTELRHAHELLSWWQATGDAEMHLSRAYQFGPNALRNAAAARAAFHVLVDHGQATELRPGTMVEGAKRREAWRVVD